MLLLAHKLKLSLVVLLLGFEEEDRFFDAPTLTDFTGVIPEEILFVFRDPALDEDVVGILFGC